MKNQNNKTNTVVNTMMSFIKKPQQLLSRVLLMLVMSVLMSTSYAIEEITYYHNDALGSPVAATDEAGNLKWREAYQPYGSRLLKEDGGTNDTWFTGKQEDKATGLSYFGARWYDPVLGRFTGIDPVGFKEKNIQSFNRYAYAANNPYKYVDPDGKEIVANQEAAKVINKLWNSSKTARMMITQLAGSKKTYNINIDTKSTSGNAAATNPYSGAITIKSRMVESGKFKNRDDKGGTYAPSIERTMAHEMGHAYTMDKKNSRFAGSTAGLRQSTILENKVAKERNPKAPKRNESGNGGH